MEFQEATKMILDLSRIVPKNIYTKSGDKTYRLHISYQGERILIANPKDKHHDVWYPQHITIPNGKICLWYSWPSGRNQSQINNSGKRYNYLIIPRFLPLDKLTMNALGLLQAEMTRGKLRKSTLSFTNSEPNLINVVMELFKRFKIEPLDWSWNITFNYKLKEFEDSEKTLQREQESEKFWHLNASINQNSKCNKIFFYTGNKKYKNMRKCTMRLGSLKISHSDIIFYQFIRQLLEEIKLVASKEVIQYYLQGIFAGEGCVRQTIFGSLDNVNVGAVNKEDQLLFARHLNVLGIICSIQPNCVKIHNLKNFIKIYHHQLLCLHPVRQKKFLECLSKFKQIPQELKAEYYFIREKVIIDVDKMV